MVLPDVHPDDIYNRADVVRRLSEWVFSSTFNKTPPPTHEVVTFAIPSPLTPVPISPNAPRRPSALDLKGDDNFLPPHAVQSILRASEKREKPKRAPTLELPVNSVFCLSGPAGSGKTQLAARMSEWLLQLKCLGGYFTFDGGSDHLPSRPTLDALPVTLIHQVVTAERDTIGSFSKTLAVGTGALTLPLEKRFETLFVEPLRDFVAGRVNAKWNPLDPLVFIIDGIGARGSHSAGGGGEDPLEDREVAKALVDWICSSGFGKLPRFVKFLVFMRSESEVERLLKERGVDVLEMGPGSLASPPMEIGIGGGLITNGGRWPVNSSAVKSGARTLLANQL